MADSSLAVSGGTVDTWQLGAGDHQQKLRMAPVTVPSLVEWTLATTAATPVGADAARIKLVLYNDSPTNTVFIRLDATAPTTSSYMLAVPPGATLDVGAELAPLNVRTIASAAGGVLHCTLGATAA